MWDCFFSVGEVGDFSSCAWSTCLLSAPPPVLQFGWDPSSHMIPGKRVAWEVEICVGTLPLWGLQSLSSSLGPLGPAVLPASPGREAAGPRLCRGLAGPLLPLLVHPRPAVRLLTLASLILFPKAWPCLGPAWTPSGLPLSLHARLLLGKSLRPQHWYINLGI